jgi:hypothetical protein
MSGQTWEFALFRSGSFLVNPIEKPVSGGFSMLSEPFWKPLLAAVVPMGVVKADSITASLFSPEAPSGTTPLVIDLAGVTPPSDSALVGTGYSISSSVGSGQGLVQGTNTGAHATPVAGVTDSDAPEYLTGCFGSALTTDLADSGNYFSTGTGAITLTFSTDQTSLALLWGSIDTGNSVTLNDVGNFTVTGTEVQTAASGFVGNVSGATGQRLRGDTSTPFTTAMFSSSVVSFEFAGVAAADSPFTSAVPEPISVALSGIGLMIVLLLRLLRLRAIN